MNESALTMSKVPIAIASSPEAIGLPATGYGMQSHATVARIVAQGLLIDAEVLIRQSKQLHINCLAILRVGTITRQLEDRKLDLAASTTEWSSPIVQ